MDFICSRAHLDCKAAATEQDSPVNYLEANKRKERKGKISGFFSLLPVWLSDDTGSLIPRARRVFVIVPRAGQGQQS